VVLVLPLLLVLLLSLQPLVSCAGNNPAAVLIT
jgi:hypothetical protein